ncbi:helix-turn-helix domain-containing protein [Enterococcus hirae]|nr:helix-turn-helix domain-containing protein [Enterococcus hirae]EMF0159268.1 helix-turn-helix domain-containing protein [Enterococcus hirae]
METLGKRIRSLREQKNWTQTELSQELGMKTYTTVSKWENDENFPKGKDLKKLAELFNVSSDYLLGLAVESKQDDISTIYNQLDQKRQAKVYNFADRQLREQNKKVVPLVGQTAANPTELTYGDETYDETVETNVPKSADYALVVKGDSMEPIFADGSIVFYKQQDDVENGEIAVVEIDGNGVTLKKVYFNYDNETVILRSLNDKYEDRVLHPDEVRIIGKVVK